MTYLSPQQLNPARAKRPRSGFTLIELVVVIGILAIVGVLIIPSIRTLNEDRKIRDTARVVGGVFAAARERAAVDGQAGVEIVSIPSANGNYNVPNMGLILYELRGIPAYVGDALGAGATTVNVAGELRTTFIGADVVNANVQAGDSIELNGSGIKLRILSVVEITMPPGDPTDDYLVIENPAPNPPLPAAADLPFKIHRQPVRIESSAIRLPNNLFLNMALSGHGTPRTTIPTTENQWEGRQFRDFQLSDPPSMPVTATEGSTQIWFAADGSVSYVRSRGFIPSPTTTYTSSMQKPDGPIHLLMANGNNDDVDLSNLDSAAFLQDDNNMWITINHRTGSVSMGKMAQINTVLSVTNTLRTQIQDSRLLARNRRSATP